MLQSDRHLEMHEQMKNINEYICVHVIFFFLPVSPYGRSCVFSSWCRLDVCSRPPRTPPESHTGDPCSAGPPPTWCRRTALERPANTQPAGQSLVGLQLMIIYIIERLFFLGITDPINGLVSYKVENGNDNFTQWRCQIACFIRATFQNPKTLMMI